MNRLLAALSVMFLAVGWAVGAADPPAPPSTASDSDLQKTKAAAAFDQERLRRQFSDFQQKLLALAQRYEKSSKPEELERALVLKQAIDLAAKEGVDNQFSKLVITLTANGVTLSEIDSAIGQNEQLAKTLREMIALLLTDNQTAKLKEEQRRLQELLKQLDKVIREQKLERSKTESGRMDNDELARGQSKVTDDTRKLSKSMGDKADDGKNAKGEGKGEGKDGKPQAEGKDDTKDAKAENKDPKGEGDKKDGEGKPGQGEAEAKTKGQGEGEGKGGKPKEQSGDPQPMNPGDNKAKPEGKGENKPGQGQGDAKGQPKAGQAQQGQQGQGKGEGGDSPPNGNPQPQPPQQPQDDVPGQRQVKDAIENQNSAERNLKKNDRPKASDEQDEAIKKLEEVRKEIERRLKQLREEELLQKLANLEGRCARMLAMQIEVYDGTKRLFSTIKTNEGQKASRAEDQKAGELSGREGQIVVEANKAIQLLEEDGSAVAIPQVLEQAREDMKNVQARLFKTDVGPFTQQVEEEIIASLKEVIEALKKAQQDIKDRKDQPPPPPGGGKPPDQQLINLLAELKMIRSLQVRVNQRTTMYGKQYPGEQADEPDIQKELRGLAQRQIKIEKATKDIATGKVGGQ